MNYILICPKVSCAFCPVVADFTSKVNVGEMSAQLLYFI